MRSDEQLVTCYQDSGQSEALDELTERHLGTVRAMIYPMVLDKTLADDLTQEVLLRVFRGLASFDGRSRFSTWLYRVTMNTAHGFLARHRRGGPGLESGTPEIARIIMRTRATKRNQLFLVPMVGLMCLLVTAVGRAGEPTAIEPVEKWADVFSGSEVKFHYTVRTTQAFDGRLNWSLSVNRRTVEQGNCR